MSKQTIQQQKVSGEHGQFGELAKSANAGLNLAGPAAEPITIGQAHCGDTVWIDVGEKHRKPVTIKDLHKTPWFVSITDTTGAVHKLASADIVVFRTGADVPEWVEDGVTPHPTGGYVSVKVSVGDNGRTQSDYFDADGLQHRLDGPAHERHWFGRSGAPAWQKTWYRHGQVHRDGGLPAVSDSYGNAEWFEDADRYASFSVDSSAGKPKPRFEAGAER